MNTFSDFVSLIVLTCGTTGVVAFIALELAAHEVYGKLLSDKKYLKTVEDLLENAIINNYDSDLLYTGKNYINRVEKPLSKYEVDRLGRIPRWSKMHKLIKEKYKTLNEQNNKS